MTAASATTQATRERFRSATGASSPVRVPWLCDGFVRYGRWFVRRNFHAVRLLRGTAPVVADDVPVVVYLNHPSWWDPMIALIAATTFFPRRRHFAPIDEAMLGKYKVFGKLGFFGIEKDSPRGGAKFLRTSLAIASEPDTALWITAEGEFTDPRRRPVVLRPGLARLVQRLGRAVVLPMALDYVFWNERFPEALVAFGEPVDVSLSPPDGEELAAKLEQTMDRLAAATMMRDAGAFDTILGGSAGVGGMYDLCRRGAAWARGRRFDPSHGGEPS